MMTHCGLIRTPLSAMAEGAKNTLDYGRLAKLILPKETNAHHITTGPIGLPEVIDDGAVGEGKGESTFDSDGLVLPLSSCTRYSIRILANLQGQTFQNY